MSQAQSMIIIVTLSVLVAILIYKIAKEENKELEYYNTAYKNYLLSEEVATLKKEIDTLQHKELILYLVAEILHNKEDRETTYGEEETCNILSQSRVFTPYYGDEKPNMVEMKNFIDYLSNDAWTKLFKKPASETIPKINTWAKIQKEV